MELQIIKIARRTLLPGRQQHTVRVPFVTRGEKLPESTVHGWVKKLKNLEENHWRRQMWGMHSNFDKIPVLT